MGDRGRADPQAGRPHHRHHGRLAQPGRRYDRVIYYAARPAQPVLSRAAGHHLAGLGLVTITDLPAAATMPGLP